VKNVRFVNILARGENGVYIEAMRPGLLDGILLENVRMEIDAWSDERGGRYDRRPYSGDEKIYDHPTSAFYISNASNVTVRNCEVAWGSATREYWGHALEAENSDGLVIDGFVGESAFPDRLDAIVQR
jgi:hypothetical protein